MAKKNRKKAIETRVGVVMGSESDLKVMQGAIDCLESFDIPAEIRIVSAHRTPKAMIQYAEEAEARGLKVLIAGAGGAAHLPGMIASVTSLPVIGIPVNITKLQGVDSLLSILQMPKGVPVATVAIDNSYNAGLLAVRILATADGVLKKELVKFRKNQEKKVKAANDAL